MRNRIEIDLGQIKSNLDVIKPLLPKRCELIVMLNANAYGHGDVAIAKFLEEKCDIKTFALADFDAAMRLRRAGIKSDILLLSYVATDELKLAVENDIIISLLGPEHAVELSKAAASLGITLRAHIAINTGMNRLGFDAKAFKQMMTLAGVYHLPGIKAEGVYSHLSSAADSSKGAEPYTTLQLERFEKVASYISERGMSYGKRHIANSAAIAKGLGLKYDAARCGSLLYGYNSTNDVKFPVKPAIRWTAKISMTRNLEFGDSVSYSRTYTASKATRCATVCVGFADGLPKELSGKAFVLLHGTKCPIIGEICMDQMMIDISGVKEDVRMGDLVTIIGSDGEFTQSAEDLARISKRSVYEILTGLSERTERIYIGG